MALMPGRPVRVGNADGVIGVCAWHLGKQSGGIPSMWMWGPEPGGSRPAGVRVGSPVTLVSEARFLGKHRVSAKAMDNRVACAVLLGVLEALHGVETAATLVGVVTVQEEVGLRGAHMVAGRIPVSAAISVDIMVTGDTPDCDGTTDSTVRLARGRSSRCSIRSRRPSASLIGVIGHPRLNEPNPRALKALAEVIGRSHIQLLHWLGILPAELSYVPVRLEATEKLREALSDTQRWVEAAGVAIGLSSGSLVANALLNATSKWRVTMDPAERGEHFPAPYEIRIAFAPRESQAEALTDTDRKRILAHVRDASRRTSAEWRDPSESEGWEARPDLVLVAPSLLASRPRAQEPNFEVPESIMVVGVPYAGGRTVAASCRACSAGPTTTWAPWPGNGSASMRARPSCVPRRRLPSGCSRSRGGRSAHGLVLRFARTDQQHDRASRRGGRQPSAGDLLEGRRPAAGVRVMEDRKRVTMVESVQNKVRWRLRERQKSYPDGQCTLDLHLPPGLQIGARSARDDHVLFDAYVEQAFAAAAWLHERHRGPSLDEASGLLADLWRAGRQQR
jgi:hypothetical protein